MNSRSLVFPMFAMVLLTFGVAVMLFRARVRSVREGVVSVGYFRVFQGSIEPDYLAKPTRHFSNLFEQPTLFYAGCLAAMTLGAADALAVTMAWVYVGARLLHTAIHLGGNRLRHRMRLYLLSWLALLALWVDLAFVTARLAP
jgi:hypothetical protein